MIEEIGYVYESADEADFILAVFENKMVHLEYEFETLMLEHTQNISNIETKLIVESGTESDALLLYTREAEEVSAKGKSILSRIINALKNLGKKIKNFFTRSKANEDRIPEKLTVDENPDKLISDNKSLLQSVTSFIAGHKTESILAAIAAIGTGTAIATTVSKSKYNTSRDQLEKLDKEYDGKINDLQSSIDGGKLSEKELSITQKVLAKMQNGRARILKFISKVPMDPNAEDNRMNANFNNKKNENSKAVEGNASAKQGEHAEKISDIAAQNKEIDSVIKAVQNQIKDLESGLSIKDKWDSRKLSKLSNKNTTGKLSQRDKMKFDALNNSQQSAKLINHNKELTEKRNMLTRLTKMKEQNNTRMRTSSSYAQGQNSAQRQQAVNQANMNAPMNNDVVLKKMKEELHMNESFIDDFLSIL